MRTYVAAALAIFVAVAPVRAEAPLPAAFGGPDTGFGMAREFDRLVALLGDDVLREMVCRLSYERYSPQSLGRALNQPSGQVMRRVDTLHRWGLVRMVGGSDGMVVERLPGQGERTLRRWADKYCGMGDSCGRPVSATPPDAQGNAKKEGMAMGSGGGTAADGENILYLDLKDGRVVIRLRPDLAPNHVKRIKELVRQGFYDGLNFHRVINGFMAQDGDPRGNGTGGSGRNIRHEFSPPSVSHKRGILSMARAADPDSADSQFFIMLADSPHLDGQYSIWGEVIEGMEYVDKIKKGSDRDNGTVQNPDKIIRMRIAADMNE